MDTDLTFRILNKFNLPNVGWTVKALWGWIKSMWNSKSIGQLHCNGITYSLLKREKGRMKLMKVQLIINYKLENYIIHNMHWIYLCSEGQVTYLCENSHSSLFQNSKILQLFHSVRKWELNLDLNAGYFTSWLTFSYPYRIWLQKKL